MQVYSLKTQHIMLNIFQLHRLVNQEAGKTANSTWKEFHSNALAQQAISPEVWWREDTGLAFLSYEIHCNISLSIHEHACDFFLATFLKCLILYSLSGCISLTLSKCIHFNYIYITSLMVWHSSVIFSLYIFIQHILDF